MLRISFHEQTGPPPADTYPVGSFRSNVGWSALFNNVDRRRRRLVQFFNLRPNIST